MPMPSVLPTPVVSPREDRLTVPLEAQEASYFAASARISSFFRRSMCRLLLGFAGRWAIIGTRRLASTTVMGTLEPARPAVAEPMEPVRIIAGSKCRHRERA